MPLLRRRRPLLRAAAVSGGAYMYGKHRAGLEADQQEQAYEQGQQDMLAGAPPAAAPVAPPRAVAGASPDDITRLQQLGQLHDQGVLTDEEFTRQKTIILGS